MNQLAHSKGKPQFGFWLGLVMLLSGTWAHAIVLGGATVPKEKMVLYLFIGHSNMHGIDYAHSDGVTAPHVWNYQWNSTKTWVLAKEPPNNKTAGLSGHGSGGPAMPFLKGMALAYPDYYFGVINTASSSATCRGENLGNNGSGLDPADNRYWKGSYLYVQLLTAVKAVQNDVTLGGILCMLGTVEATRTSDSVCRSFSNDISQLVKDLRTDLNAPNLPFIMGEYEAGATGNFLPTLPMPSIIVSETKLIPSKLPLSITVDSKGIEMIDDHHYTAIKGEGEWARRAIAGVQAKAWFPPSLISAPILKPKEGSGAHAKAGHLKGWKPGTIQQGGELYLINGETIGALAEPAPIKITAP